jgi:asparagine synthase (glutamine-hydrolysing)
MAGALEHRGPDGFGIYRDRHVALAHARLSIIDLDGGWQPMANADESVWVCFNGEIFNYIELRDELVKKGYVFKTKSDTETLVHAYSAWGEAMIDRLNGQWAFVIWDTKRRRVLMSRDNVGILPLFYTVHQGVFRFASEVKALFQDPSVPRALSKEGLDEALTFWAPMAPMTPYQGVRQLPPGSVGILELDRDVEPRVQVRWAPKFPTERERDVVVKQRFDLVREVLHGGSTPPPARRRARRQLPLGRARQLGSSRRRSRRTARSRCARSRSASKTRSTTRPKYQDAAVRLPEDRPRGRSVLGRRHRARLPGRRLPRRAPLLRTAPAPLNISRELVRKSGLSRRAHRRRRRRVLRGLRHLPRGSRAPLLGAQPRVEDAPAALVAALPVPPALTRRRAGEMAKAFFGKGLERIDDPASRTRRAGTRRRAEAPARARDARGHRRRRRDRALPRAAARGLRALDVPRARRSTSRSRRCCRATCCRRRASGC